VTCVAAAVKSNTMCILAAFKKMVCYLALPLVSMLETYNNVSNQVSSFFDLYQYLNTGMDVTQLKSSAHSPWQLNICSISNPYPNNLKFLYTDLVENPHFGSNFNLDM